ncbi:MAG: ABC transporter permease [Azospirillaceae bacterium]
MAALPAAAPKPPRVFARFNALGAASLFRREVKRVLKEWPETVIAPSFSSLLYVAVFVLALGPERGTPEAEALIGFVVPGLVVLTLILRAAETTVFTILFDKLEGAISDVLMPPLQASELTIGYAAAGVASALMTMAPMLAIAILALDLPVERPVVMAFFSVAGALMLALAGILMALWADKWDHAEAAFTFLLLPMAFLSGVFAPVESLPAVLEPIGRWNPVAAIVDGFRTGALGEGARPVALNAALLIAWTAALGALAHRLIARGYKLRA